MAVSVLVFVLLFCGSGLTQNISMNHSESTDRRNCLEGSDLTFLLDGFMRIAPSDLPHVQDFVRSMMSGLTVTRNKIKVVAVHFEDQIFPRITPDQDYNQTTVVQKDVTLHLPSGDTGNTGAALQHMATHYLSKVLVVMMSGVAQDDVLPAAEELRRLGVQVYVIGFFRADLSEMLLIGSSPRHVFTLPSTKFLFVLTQQLCSPDVQCQTTARADIVLLVDGSSAIHWFNFKIVKNFIARLVSIFDIGPERVQIGLVQFSDDPKTEWFLNTHPTKASLLEAVANVTQKRGNITTGLALDYILHSHFCPGVGLREDARKIGVLITAGKSQDEIEVKSQNLRDSGIELYTIGVTNQPEEISVSTVKDVDEKELRSIASDPDHIHAYNVTDFSFLYDIVDNLTVNLCNSAKGAGPAVSTGPAPPPPSVSSGPSPKGPLSTGPSPQGPLSTGPSLQGPLSSEPSPQEPLPSGGPSPLEPMVLVQWGQDFTVSCFVEPHSLDGFFLLLTPFGNHTLPAVNHSAHFLFPAFSPAHWGQYTCVYLLQVQCGNHTFQGSGLRFKSGASVSELLIRAAVVVIILLFSTIALYFYYKPRPKPTRGRRRGRTPESDLSLRVL